MGTAIHKGIIEISLCSECVMLILNRNRGMNRYMYSIFYMFKKGLLKVQAWKGMRNTNTQLGFLKLLRVYTCILDNFNIVGV